MTFSPTSGWEPSYEPQIWSSRENCYAYAMNQFSGFLQPGDLAGVPRLSRPNYSCANVLQALQQDVPGMYMTDFGTACAPNFRKLFLAVDPASDFHFYRQDANEYWSHKLGSRPVTDRDASSRRIPNPLVADRRYSRHNYDTPCAFFCVPETQNWRMHR